MVVLNTKSCFWYVCLVDFYLMETRTEIQCCKIDTTAYPETTAMSNYS